MPAGLLPLARRAVAACPTLALLLTDGEKRREATAPRMPAPDLRAGSRATTLAGLAGLV